MNLHKDDYSGHQIREAYLDGLEAVLAQRQEASHAKRDAFFQPDFSSPEAYAASLPPYREKVRDLLGWPLNDPSVSTAPKLLKEKLYAEDGLGKIYRLQVEVLPGVPMYAMLFLPHTEGPHELVIAQHGGGGTPEIVADFQPWDTNYGHMTRRLQKRGYAVLSPQLLLWRPRDGPEIDRRALDDKLKATGSSITAIEMHALQQMLTYALSRPDIKGESAGMAGLSYGGFFTLLLAALETRIRAAVSSCSFNQRYAIDGFTDWNWTDSGNWFQDEQLIGLVAPRPIYVEYGTTDELFACQSADDLSAKAKSYHEKLGLGDRVHVGSFPGGHEFDQNEANLDFLHHWLQSTA